MSGSLDMIVGCMFSGKSTEMIHRIRKFRIIGKSVLVVNHSLDTRYDHEGGKVMTHNQDAEVASKVAYVSDITRLKDFPSANVICIEEAQFFPDLYEGVVKLVEENNKHVVLSGLDGDYLRQPFDQVVRLIPFADSTIKLQALCCVCKDGTPGSFSKRITASTSQVEVGGIETYIPVCRKHF